MSTPRKHHYLPQFYLEAFKIHPQNGKEPHIWQIEKEGEQKHYSPAVKDTGCIRDYHSIDHDNQELDHKTVELMLSQIEGKQAELTKSIIDSKSVNSSQIIELSAFISLMRYRIPTFAAHVESSHKALVLDTFKIMYKSGKFGTCPDVLKQVFESEGIDKTINIEISNWRIVKQMFNVALSTENTSLLSQLNYQVYHSKELDAFVTSDNPVALYHPNYNALKPYGVGLAIKDVELTMPLSSDTLLMAGGHLKPGSYTASTEQVNEFNRRTIIMGESYVFSSNIHDKLRKDINELKGLFAGFKHENLFYGDGSVHISRFIPVQ